MKRLMFALAASTLLLQGVGVAQPISTGRPDLMTNVPSGSRTVTDWYKQDVYNPSNHKIGEVSDVLVDQNGQIAAVIVGVGGFLGAGKKDVAVNFSSIKQVVKDDKTYLTMDANKDSLKAAPGFKYDRHQTSWIPDTSK